MILALPIILKEHFSSLTAMLFYYMDVNRGTKGYRYLNSFNSACELARVFDLGLCYGAALIISHYVTI